MANLTYHYEPATYRYAHHMGSGEQLPALARVTNRDTGRCVEITGDQFPGLERGALLTKAAAILCNGRIASA